MSNASAASGALVLVLVCVLVHYLLVQRFLWLAIVNFHMFSVNHFLPVCISVDGSTLATGAKTAVSEKTVRSDFISETP